MTEASTTATTVPTIPGTPFEGGIYAGITRGDDASQRGT